MYCLWARLHQVYYQNLGAYEKKGRNSIACIFLSGRVKLIVTSELLNIYESQVIFPSKETQIVSVDLRTAEVPYTNQSKTTWKSEVGQMLGQLFRNISRLYMTFDHKGKVVKSVHPIFFLFRYTAIYLLDDH
jgi:hypothetical protein